MAELPTVCPSCHASLMASRLKCESCSTQLEGEFEIPALLLLSEADLEFVVRFVKASGSLKEMARHHGQSYPTIRNRLNEIISKLEMDEKAAFKKRRDILDAISKGRLSVAEGEKMLTEMTR